MLKKINKRKKESNFVIKIPEEEAKQTSELLEDVKKQLENTLLESDKLKELNSSLMEQLQKLSPHLQAEQESATPEDEPSTTKSEDVVDADFEVVDEEEKEETKK